MIGVLAGGLVACIIWIIVLVIRVAEGEDKLERLRLECQRQYQEHNRVQSALYKQVNP